MFFYEVNPLAVLLCGVANLAVGFIWYGLLFRDPWVALVNKSEEELAAMEKSAPKAYGISLIMALVTGFVLANVLAAVKADSVLDGVFWAFLLWLGIEVFSRLEGVLFEKRPFKLFLINTFFNLTLFVVMAIILVLL